jgi:hypothetical protein
MDAPASGGADEKRTLGDTMGAEDKSYEDIDKEKKMLKLEIQLNKVADDFYRILKDKNPTEAALWDFKVIKKMRPADVVDDIVDNGTNYGDINEILKPILETNSFSDPKKDSIIKSKREQLVAAGTNENQIKKTLCKYYLSEVNKNFKRKLLHDPSALRNLFTKNNISIKGNSLSKEKQEEEMDKIIYDYVDSVLGKKNISAKEKVEKVPEKEAQPERQPVKPQDRDSKKATMDPSEIEKWLTSQGLAEPDAVTHKKSDEYDDEDPLYEAVGDSDVDFLNHQYNPREFISKLLDREVRNEQMSTLRMEIRRIINKNCNIL